MKINFFSKKKNETDLSNYFPNKELSHKQKLINICMKKKISIYIDDPSNDAESILRPVASEAEIERRLKSHESTFYSKMAFVISLLSFIVAVLALLNDFVKA